MAHLNTTELFFFLNSMIPFINNYIHTNKWISCSISVKMDNLDTIYFILF